MATNTFVSIDIPEAAALKDLTGIKYDLERARAFATRLKKIFDADSLETDLIEPLTIAALVTFIRPFGRDARQRNLKISLLEEFTDAQRKAFDHLKAFRDKHVVHSENSYEESQPIARFWVERVYEEGIASVECNHAIVVGLDAAEVRDMIELTGVLLRHVDQRLVKEKAKIDLSPFAHPIESRVSSSFEPISGSWATGRGAEPSTSGSGPARCLSGAPMAA
jgi:hypothetical protein